MTRSRSNKQLYTLIPKLTLFGHRSLGVTTTLNGDNLPFISWPDKTPCLAANLYILTVMRRKGRGRGSLSRRGDKGGTVGGIAGQISHLIRFCYYRRRKDYRDQVGIDFKELTDDDFIDFMSKVRTETRLNKPDVLVREEITTKQIGLRCLDLLEFIGITHGIENFVSEEGVIKARKITVTKEVKSKSTGKKKVIYHDKWEHSSLGGGGIVKKRGAISTENITKIKEANKNIHAEAIREELGKAKKKLSKTERDKARFLQNRRSRLILLLENTGARIGELGELRVEDVVKAGRMSDPMLRLVTLKKGGDTERLIPISRHVLNELKTHIRIHRNPVVNRVVGKKNDDGFFFVGLSTGTRIKDGTLTKEIAILRKAAGITEQACGHMFRGTFITKLFVLLIQRHEFENNDEFRKQLINGETFKADVISWTGHASTNSLDPYIDEAFKVVTNYEETVQSAEMILLLSQYENAERDLLQNLKNGRITTDEYVESMENLYMYRRHDMRIKDNVTH